jgi:hypothetical protein
MGKIRTSAKAWSSGPRSANSYGKSYASAPPRKGRNRKEQELLSASKIRTGLEQQFFSVEKQVAEVFRQTPLYSLPYREMVTLGMLRKDNKAEKFLIGSDNQFVYSSLSYFLQAEEQLPDLLLPEDRNLRERVQVLWQDLLDRVRSWRTWNARFQARRPLGTFFERNQWALWQATEKALRKRYTPYEIDLMVEEGLITESNPVGDSYEEWDAEEEFLPQEVEATC